MESDEIIQLLKNRKATKYRVSVKRPKGRTLHMLFLVKF